VPRWRARRGSSCDSATLPAGQSFDLLVVVAPYGQCWTWGVDFLWIHTLFPALQARSCVRILLYVPSSITRRFESPRGPSFPMLAGEQLKAWTFA